MSHPLARTLRTLYRRLFRRAEDAHTRAVRDVLGRVPLFQSISPTTLYDLAEIMHQRTYRPGEPIYLEGDPALGLFVVEAGEVRLLTEGGGGAMHELRRVGPDASFGERSAVCDVRRQETAQAISETRVLGFFRPDLDALINRNPAAAAEVLRALAGYLTLWQGALVDALVADARAKEEVLARLHTAAAATEDDLRAELPA